MQKNCESEATEFLKTEGVTNKEMVDTTPFRYSIKNTDNKYIDA